MHQGEAEDEWVEMEPSEDLSDAGEDILKLLKDRKKVPLNREEMGKNIIQRFRTFGWSNGLHVPFANAANQLLEEKLDAKQKKVLALQAELQDHGDHLKTLTDNFNRISEDVNAHQVLITYKKSDIKITENLVNIAERVHSKVIQEKLNDIVQTENLEKRNYQLRKQLVKREEIIGELVEIVNYDKKLLEIYKRRTENAEGEIDTVVEFKTTDERQLYENEAKQVDLGAKRKLLRYRLDHEAMDTSKCQEQFNRASMEYRKVHDQRKEMISIWTKTLSAMRFKDKLMKEVADEYYALREHCRELDMLLQMKERRLKEEQCGIKGEELVLKGFDRRVADARMKFTTENASLFDNVSDYTTLNSHLHSISYQERTASKKAKDLKKGLQAMYKETETTERLLEALREKSKEVLGTTKTSTEQITEAETILQTEENNLDEMEKKLKWGQQFFWERSNEKVGIQSDIVGVETRLHRIKNSTSILYGKISENLEMLGRKSSKIYRLDLDASNLETRISRIEHETIDPSYFALQDRIVANRGMEQKLKDEQKFISKELEILKEHTYRTRREIQTYIDERKSLKYTLFEVDLVAMRNTKLFKKKVKEFHDAQVRHSLLQVYLKRLERARESTREQLGSLSEQRALVETVVKERTVEIDMHKALNDSKLKALRGATNKLNVHIGELENFISRLKGRFYLTSRLMMGPENSDPKEQTFSYQIRKAARERELLNKEVLKWQDAVDVAQKELEGLQNALVIMQASNANFKKSISPAEENSHEHITTMNLEEIERQTLVNKNRAKKAKHILQNDINELQQQVTVVEQDLFASRAACDTKTHLASSSITELYRQQDKIARWNSLITRLTREIKGYISKELEERVQKELRLKFTSEKLDCSMSMVERLLGSFPALIPKVLTNLQSNEGTEDLFNRIKQHYASDRPSAGFAGKNTRQVGRQNVNRVPHITFSKNAKKGKKVNTRLQGGKTRANLAAKSRKSIVDLLAGTRMNASESTVKTEKP